MTRAAENFLPLPWYSGGGLGCGAERRLAHESPTLTLPRSTRGGEEESFAQLCHTPQGGSWMKTKQQVVSEFRRAEIVDAARSIFARKGFVRGIMDEIAKEAGIAKGTLYLYFRSEAEIYRAVLDRDMEFLKKGTLERIDAAKNLKDKIRAFTLARLENAEAQEGILPDHGHRIGKFVLHAKPIP